MAARTVFVIVGGGLAGAKAAEALRDNGFDGRVVIFADERHYPYNRPPLTKEFLAAKTSPIARAYSEADKRLTLKDLIIHDASWFRDHDVELQLGSPVTSVDPGAHTVAVADGGTVRYDKLLLATGARARRLEIPGSGAEQVHYLRTVDDATALDAALVAGSTLAVVGAGWLGLEAAASARQRGVQVSLLGRSRLPLLSALGAQMGTVFAELHREHAVALRLSAQVTAITTSAEKATGVALADGARLDADAILVAVGAQPNLELASQAGLAIADNAVLVDASMRTSHPDIYAVGDVVVAHNPRLAARIRTGHWADALKQPAVAAAGMLGQPAEYTDLPYFFTDQYELGMEYVGYAPEYRQVIIRGDVDAREFIAFWLDDDDRVLAGMSVNVLDAIDAIKAVVRTGNRVDLDRLADPDQPLDELARR